MYCYVWEYRVAAESREAFEQEYGPTGSWVRLFARDPAYLGTELLRDGARAGRYLTVDRWSSREACRAFREGHREEFEAIDRRCEQLTEEERSLGDFDLVP